MLVVSPGHSVEVAMPISRWATAQASSEQVANLRRNPGLPAGYELPAGFLKNSDDQTVLALVVVSQALAAREHPRGSHSEWGVLAAPNFFGRSGTHQALVSFRKDGAWGISPHMIPHHSLHAASGTISQTLGMHGPNFGVSGGPNAAAEAFLIAATLVSENTMPGLWVVLTGHEWEWLPGEEGKDAQNECACLAVALALESCADGSKPCLYVSPQNDEKQADFTLSGFVNALHTHQSTFSWRLPACGTVRLSSRGEHA